MVSRNVAIGGSKAIDYIKDREPVFDEETGTYICGESMGRPGLLCKGAPVAPRWKCRRHGGAWKVTQKGLALAKGTASIYDSHRLWRGYNNIRKELTGNPEFIEQLYSTDLGEELAVARIVLAELIKKDGKDSPDKALVIKALQLISKIAKTAKDIREQEDNVIKREFMDGIIAAITHAFTRSNGYERPSDRARVFMSEFAALLPGNPAVTIPNDDPGTTVEGKLVDVVTT